MESVADVIAILRHEGRQDLAALLADAYVEFEYLDTGFSMTSDAEFDLFNAAIYAPIAACKALRELPQEDESLILFSLQEAWPTSQSGGMVIQRVSYNINKDSLQENFTLLYTSPTGWTRVDRTLERVRVLLATASTEEQFQEVGTLCRDGLISLAQSVFDPEQHAPLPDDDIDVSNTDVKRIMARFLESEFPGASNKHLRKCVDSTWDFANKVTHKRTATYRDAALCAQATFNLTGLIAIISGKRDFR